MLLALLNGSSLDLADLLVRLRLRLVDDQLNKALARLDDGQPADPLELDELALLELGQVRLLGLDLALLLLESDLASLKRFDLAIEALERSSRIKPWRRRAGARLRAFPLRRLCVGLRASSFPRGRSPARARP